MHLNENNTTSNQIRPKKARLGSFCVVLLLIFKTNEHSHLAIKHQLNRS